MATAIRTSLYGNRAGLTDKNDLVLGGRPFSVTATQTKGAANVTNVMLQVVDNNDVALALVMRFDLWLSDAASGLGLTAVTASGTVVVGTPGADLADVVAKKFKTVMTDATGRYQLVITDTAKTAFFLCIGSDVLSDTGPSSGNFIVAPLTAALYGP